MTATEPTERLRAIVTEFNADGGTLHMLGDDGLLHLAAYVPDMPEQVVETIRAIPVGKGMAGLAVERAEPVDACNIQTDDSGDVRPGARQTGLKGAIVVPVFDGERPVGALGVGNAAERTFTPDEVERLLALAAEFAAG